jgi:hypothetical protein
MYNDIVASGFFYLPWLLDISLQNWLLTHMPLVSIAFLCVLFFSNNVLVQFLVLFWQVDLCWVTDITSSMIMCSGWFFFSSGQFQDVLFQVKVCVATLSKYLENILLNPTDDKFRKIRKSNKAFQVLFIIKILFNLGHGKSIPLLAIWVAYLCI